MFNYPVKITPENAGREYQLAANMLRVINAKVAVCMLIMEFVFINISMGEDMALSPPFLVLYIGLLTLTIVYFVYEMRKQKQVFLARDVH
jgi:L-asparagine transporter-like permease